MLTECRSLVKIDLSAHQNNLSLLQNRNKCYITSQFTGGGIDGEEIDRMWTP